MNQVIINLQYLFNRISNVQQVLIMKNQANGQKIQPQMISVLENFLNSATNIILKAIMKYQVKATQHIKNVLVLI